jgi:predicted nucleotidyltransferase
MDQGPWKIKKLAEVLGISHLDTRYVHPNLVIDLRDEMFKFEDVKALILYGSVVRGDASEKSDIDLLAVFASPEGKEGLLTRMNAVLRILETRYHLKISFSLKLFTGDEDNYFLWEVASDGVVVFCRPEAVMENRKGLKPYALISYSLTGLDGSAKKKVLRHLFSSKSGSRIDMSNKMEYIAQSVLMLSVERSKEVVEFFEAQGVDYSLRKVWL